MRIERERQSALADAIDRAARRPADGSLSALVRTASDGSYPTTANVFYAVNPVEVDGSQQEGASPTFTADVSRVFHAYNLGSAVPPLGTEVIVHLNSGRWTFTFNCCPDAP